VFELYREIVPTSKFKMEQLILLMIALAEGHDLRTSHCNTCHGALVIDPKGVWRPTCEACRFASETVAESQQHETPCPRRDSQPGSNRPCFEAFCTRLAAGGASGLPATAPYILNPSGRQINYRAEESAGGARVSFLLVALPVVGNAPLCHILLNAQYRLRRYRLHQLALRVVVIRPE
jgi:hypothetical protein